MFGSSYTGGAVYRSASDINGAMGRVYGHMGLAVITSMIVSFLVGNNTTLMQFFFTGAMKWVVIFAPLVAILAVSFAMDKFSNLHYNYFYMDLPH
jgi:FtsH-binding integral membrane protein